MEAENDDPELAILDGIMREEDGEDGMDEQEVAGAAVRYVRMAVMDGKGLQHRVCSS